MDYNKKCLKWRKELEKGRGDGLECIFTDEKGEILYKDKDSLVSVDCFFFCHRENGMRIAEITYRKTANCSIGSKVHIFIKNMCKVIFINENEKGYAFGYNETDKTQSFVMYIRIGGSVRLMWANSACHKVNCAVDVCVYDNPTDLDCLIEFMHIGNAVEEIIDKESRE